MNAMRASIIKSAALNMKDWLDRTYGIDCDVYALCEFINIDVMWILDALEKQVSFYESLIGCEDEDTDEEEDK